MIADDEYRLALAKGLLPDRTANTKRLFDVLLFEVLNECAGIELCYGAETLQPPEIDVVLERSARLSIPLSKTAAFRVYRAGRSDGTYLDDEMKERGAKSAIAQARLGQIDPQIEIIPVKFLQALEDAEKPRGRLGKFLGIS